MASGGCPKTCDNAGGNRVQVRPRSPSPRPVAPAGVQVRPPSSGRRAGSPPRFPTFRPPRSNTGNAQVRPCAARGQGGGGGGGGGGGYASPNQDFLNSSEMSSFDCSGGGISGLYSSDGSGYPSYGNSSGLNSSYGSSGRMRRTTSTTIITTEEDDDDDDDEDEDEDDDDYGGAGGGRGGCPYTRGAGGSGGGARNATYTVSGGGVGSPCANSTFNAGGGGGGRGNATYNVGGGGGGCSGGRGNATYNVSGGGLGGNTYNVSCGGGYRDPPGSGVDFSDFSEMDFESGNYSTTPSLGLYSTYNIEPASFEVGPPRPPLRGPIPGPGCPGGARDGQGPNGHNKTFTKIIKKVVTESPSRGGEGGSGGAGGGGGALNHGEFARGIRQGAQSTPKKCGGGGGAGCGSPGCSSSRGQGNASTRSTGSSGSCGLPGEVQRQLAELECTERAQINSDLAIFQQARRRLVEATTTISSSQPPVNFSGFKGNNSTQDSF